MANNKISSVNLLPEYLRTDRNNKFLSSTLDQLIQKPQIERLSGYVGSTQTPTYNSTADIYISNGNPYQLDPALITYDSLGNIQTTQGYDDLINEIAAKGGSTDNLDRLFRTEFYSYNSHIDWDKLVNYQDYYWMPSGPELLEVVTANLDVANNIIGHATASVDVLLPDGTTTSTNLSNGMLLEFSGNNVNPTFYDKSFFVEGVGTAIKLVPYDSLLISENFLSPTPDGFDSSAFESLPFDNDRELPILDQEYITINRASADLNPWSRYNRWVHKDVIRTSATLNGVIPNFSTGRAQRPIIEFKADIQLFNFGTTGLFPVDLLDTTTLDPYNSIEGSTTPVYVDGVELEEGLRVIFNAATNTAVKGKIYQIHFVVINGVRTLTLQSANDHNPSTGAAITILLGDNNNSTDWWYNGSGWVFSQQRTTLNQPPLFDLFDQDGHSYGDKDYYLSNFIGNKIFSYAPGTGANDTYLGFPIAYRNIETVGSILFENNLATDTIVVSQISKPTYTISSNISYVKIDGQYENSWTLAQDYSIPVISSTATGVYSYYEEPLSLTNNPLNGLVSEFTISELSEHVQSMIDRLPPLFDITPVRDRADYTDLGTRLISNENPISFAQMFIGKKEHNLVDAIIKSADSYNTFKLSLLNSIISVSEQTSPAEVIDQVLFDLNQNKINADSYYLSDMVGFGTAEKVRTWTIANLNNNSFPLDSDFDLTSLSLRAVYPYLNGTQLVYGQDYVFNTATTSIEILAPLAIGDVLVVNDYTDTTGSYIPPTPTKLGLYPKFIPSIFMDTSYVVPQRVIQGHDGSIMLAYNDYRDAIILEFEKRVYNNIKATYRPELFNIDSAIPGQFRTTDYSKDEVSGILDGDFVRWAAKFSIDYVSNNTFDPAQSKTWNFYNGYISSLDTPVSGSYKGLLRWLYDTDKPNLAPWEMLGLSEKPTWWETLYGAAPYTNANTALWTDLEAGSINGVVNSLYARPGLSNIIPVDAEGSLRNPTEFVTNITEETKRQSWEVGDLGPAETAWYRSSYYPFAIQRLLALTKPATYASKLYDVSRVIKNLSGQWISTTDDSFFKLSNLPIHGENQTLTSGYSVFVSEIGQARDKDYISQLRQDLSYANYNLFYKLNGFADKSTLQIVIDAYDPTSNAPGAILPLQDYTLKFNTSNPILSIAASGLIVQKLNNGYSVRGYDKQDAYFNVFKPLRNLGTPSITVGGVSEKYVVWTPSGTPATSGLSISDTVTASAAATGHFYQKGQYVQYGSKFYKVLVSHNSGSTFESSYFQSVPRLPTTGGATVQAAAAFDTSVTKVLYGTTYTNLQDVYDLIIGYGRWLESQGFIFDEYNADLGTTLDWNLTASEFLFWSTQAWATGSVLTLSPFANTLKYKGTNAVVDNLFDRFYEYSVLRADATAYPQSDLNISRTDGICTVATNPNTDGVYFVRLNLVQKEHVIVFNNYTIFNDVIFNPETGSRQRRVKLSGFRTANWAGDFASPGFVYDTGEVFDWIPNTAYYVGTAVRFNGNYYSANQNVERASAFDFTKWDILNEKPVAGLLPNFDYKIGQFEDFYSLDTDNFDAGQQKMAQHLTGYTPRPYLNNIFTDPVAQYKFYQGFIREKGTQNAINRLSKSSIQSLKGDISYTEEWAFRVGEFGSYPTYQELETPLIEGTFLENPQIINFVSELPTAHANDLIHYVLPSDLTITPKNYDPLATFATTSSIDSLLLQHSGYVRLSDVTATAYNENSLLDIANSSQLKDGDTIWLGFKQDGDWDVYRYTYYPVGVVGVYVSAPVSSITFTTQYPHGLSVGQLVGINQFNSQVDGIYRITSVDNARQFTVPSTLASITDAPLPTPGQLYVFESVRKTSFDNLPADNVLFRFSNGTKFWIDGSDTTNWEVYEKINNYNTTPTLSLSSHEQLGYAISKRKGDNVLVVGDPVNYNSLYYGICRLYEKADGSYQEIARWRIGTSYSYVPTGFGSTIVYDDTPFTGTRYGLVFVGAPLVTHGIVKISSINTNIFSEGVFAYVGNPDYNNSTNFGKFIFVERNTKNKLVLIGANNAVYAYEIKDNGGTISVTYLSKVASELNITALSGSEDATIIAIGNGDLVKIYNKSLTNIQTINIANTSINVSPDGTYMFVGNADGSYGQVSVYKNVNGTFVLDQTLYNPVAGQGMHFGSSMDITIGNDTLIVSATGINRTLNTTFDSSNMTFDGNITKIKGTEVGSGTIYVYYKKSARFVYSQELTDSYILTTHGNNFAKSIVVDDTEVIAGAPAIDNTSISSGFFVFDKIDTTTNSLSKIVEQDTFTDISPISRIAIIDTEKEKIINYLDLFDPLKGKIPGIAEQELTYKLISDPAIYSIGVAGTNNNTDKNWLDDHVGELWWDLSTAKYVWYEQGDLEYRKNNWGKLFPGATIDVYEWVSSTMLPSAWAAIADTPAGLAKGISGQPKFVDNSVISVKQVYDTITNTFSNVYYFWVKNKVTVPLHKDRRLSSYAVASAIADPSAYGLSFASIISKDAIMLSNVGNIPVGNTISINIAQDSSSSSVVTPRHTQWKLLQEGDAVNMPPLSLEQKLIDSLLGHDKFGNIVPDIALSERTRYGTSVRPRQTMFNDRHAALRNIIEFSNNVLINIPVTGKYSFKNLNAQEEIPNQYGNTYDNLVEDNASLTSIDTSGYRQAIINCTPNANGSIELVQIADAGYGYGTLNPVYSSTGTVIGYEGPTFTIANDLYETIFDNATTTFDDLRTRFLTRDVPNTYSSGFEMKTVVNEHGSIISASIIHPGNGFSSKFRLIARPQTVIVQSDDTYNGKWSQYEWDYVTYSWNRAHTQSYDTTLYWDYVDYASVDYNQYQIYTAVIGSPYELSSVSTVEGQYVKVNNGGDGNYIVLRKAADGVLGSYGDGYDLVYKQNGTIQFNSDIWDVSNSLLNWDNLNTYDQTLYDQTPDTELEYIIKALKNDLFINELKINWNLLFFKAVKYALTEQKLLDWAFKTSFINVTNTSGELYQPPVYKLNDSSFFEDYINEVKPYHTQIRNFTTEYSVLEPTYTDIIEQDRVSTIELKFDRTSYVGQSGEFEVVDTFIADGITSEFVLGWVPAFNKTGISVKINSVISLSSEWTIDYYEQPYNGYSKKFAKLVFVNNAPANNATITIKYKKSADILNATDRILAYYTATNGMIGLDLTVLMDGISYPGTLVDGQRFVNPYGGVYPYSNIEGGTWNADGRVSALGTNPEDITLSGELGFINTASGHAPEELLPGFAIDTLGINVYTQGPAQAPTIVTGYFDVSPSADLQYYPLPMLPVTVDSISVILNGTILECAPIMPGALSFEIDWAGQQLIIPPQVSSGKLSYSMVGVGGGTNNFGLIDSESVITTNSSVGIVSSGYLANIVKDVYVTVNGIPTSDYVLDVSANNRGPAVVTVNGLDSSQGNAVQAWFFTESHSNFNQIIDQQFVASSTSSMTTFTLNVEGDYIVEKIVNGVANRLLTSKNEYTIVGSTLTISVHLNPGDLIKVVTFIDTTGKMGVDIENFVGNPNRRFIMNRPVSNDIYMWVSIIHQNDTVSGLINGIDYILLDDNVTVQISDSWNISNLDTVEIISFKSPQYIDTVLGYRIFNDLLGHTTFTRLSKANTTYLTKPLAPDDTEIYVADATVLTAPTETTPGVVLINAERIEFNQITVASGGYKLDEITRGTLGTGVSPHLLYGSKVVDQGTLQVLGNPEAVSIQYIFTTATNSVYHISTSSYTSPVPGTTATIASAGIKLVDSLPYNDQLEVYYGGRQLRKSPIFVHDTTIAYDSIDESYIQGTTSDLSTQSAMLNDAYILVSSGQVWQYVGNRSTNVQYPGWVYTGLTELPQEFTVAHNNTQTIQLNIVVESNIELAIVKKSALSNTFNTVVSPGVTLPLWESSTTIAGQLKQFPTELPNSYYYEGDIVLRDQNGVPLTDENGSILTGRT